MAQHYFGGFSDWPDRKDTMRYMMGECGYAALALQSMTGWPIFSIGGAHYAVRDPEGMFWDIRGRMTEDQVRNGVGSGAVGNAISEEPATRDEILQEMAAGLNSDGPFVNYRFRKAKALFQLLVPEEAMRMQPLGGATSPAPGR